MPLLFVNWCIHLFWTFSSCIFSNIASFPFLHQLPWNSDDSHFKLHSSCIICDFSHLSLQAITSNISNSKNYGQQAIFRCSLLQILPWTQELPFPRSVKLSSVTVREYNRDLAHPRARQYSGTLVHEINLFHDSWGRWLYLSSSSNAEFVNECKILCSVLFMN